MTHSSLYAPKCFGDLIGKVLTNVRSSEEEVVFTCDDGWECRLYHKGVCCESVTVEEIVGDLENLVGPHPIEMAEEVGAESKMGDHRHQTWTFYKILNLQEYVTIRWMGESKDNCWMGESNGYYSESVDVEWNKK